jgi:hypothetical protein
MIIGTPLFGTQTVRGVTVGLTGRVPASLYTRAGWQTWTRMRLRVRPLPLP